MGCGGPNGSLARPAGGVVAGGAAPGRTFLPGGFFSSGAGRARSLKRYWAGGMAMTPDALSPEHLFEVIDQVAAGRPRRFVKHYYVGDKVIINGVEQEIRFPTPRVRRLDYDLDAALPG